MAWLIDREVKERVRRIELPWSRHGVDPCGITQRDVARMFTLIGWLYRRYFRVTVVGIGNVPGRGRAMLVGNHSGGVALDALMVLASTFYEMEPPRLAQGMAEKFINRMPVVSQMTLGAGQLPGLPENALRLLTDERLLMVFPEGARGTAKLYRERNSLVGFGTGFMRLAMETRTPIVPFGFVGCGEAIPTVMNLVKLGKLFGVPYIPVTPYIFPVPRPVALRLEYGEPTVFAGTGAEDDEVIAGHVAKVTDQIAALIARGVEARS
ncbi:MAG: acyltransferase [Myxococcales bacterium]|nr:acyltransferase [Myxococcales bacterium]